MHNHYAAQSASNDSDAFSPSPRRVPPAVSEHLQERLLTLPFADFAALIARLLARMGYQDVRIMGAMHEKGRNLHGGLDLTAYAQTGVTRALVLVQIKQYQQPVPRGFVDGLRGAMVRLGAQQGLIVTTDTFSPSARDAAQAGQHSLPLRLVGGNELVRLLLEHEVVPEPQGRPNVPVREYRLAQEKDIARNGVRTSEARTLKPVVPHPQRVEGAVTITVRFAPRERPGTGEAGGRAAMPVR